MICMTIDGRFSGLVYANPNADNKWTSGAALTFTHFCAGQPDFNSQDSPVQLLGRDGYCWDDYYFSGTAGTICEKSESLRPVFMYLVKWDQVVRAY